MPPVKCEPVHEETSLAPLYPEEEQYEEFPEEEHEEQYSMESYSQDQLQHGEPNKGRSSSYSTRLSFKTCQIKRMK